MKAKHLTLVLVALFSYASLSAGEPKASKPSIGSQEHKPIVVKWNAKQVKEHFAEYERKTGKLPSPIESSTNSNNPPTTEKKKINCVQYGPQDCAILLRRQAPWGCAICCACRLPRPTGQ